MKKNTHKARVLRHRDMQGRPVVYIPARNHSMNNREIDELTQFIVYCLVTEMKIVEIAFTLTQIHIFFSIHSGRGIKEVL